MASITNELPATPRSGDARAKSWRTVFVLLAVLVIGSAGAYWLIAGRTYHFQVVQESALYRAGNQSAWVFSHALSRGNIKTIVSLIDEEERHNADKPQFWDEEVLAEQRKIRFVSIPVKLGGWPTTQDVRAFLDVASDKGNQPVIVHCAQGVRRTGMMVAAYQLSVLGYDKARAIAAIESFGHSDRTIADVKKFIEVYDPVTRTVTQSMQQSDE